MTTRPDAPSGRGGAARRGGGLRSVAGPASGAARPILKKRGIAEGRIVSDWPEIVGPSLAACSCPETLVTGRGEDAPRVLRVRVDGPLAVELQHLEPQVIERINSYFGYKAVERLAIVRGPLPRRSVATVPSPEPDAAAVHEIEQRLQAIDDDELRAALGALGRAVLADDKRKLR